MNKTDIRRRLFACLERANIEDVQAWIFWHAYPLKNKALASLCLLMVFGPAGIQAATPRVETFAVQGSYEQWELPQDESMGMARLGLHKNVGQYLNGGVDFYAAVEGERGGFITLGLSGGIEYPLSSLWSIEAGLYLGAGGGRGGNQLVGGGLAVRENLGLRYHFSPVGSLSVGYSQVDFPKNGEINSGQFYLGYNHSFGALLETTAYTEGRDVFLADIPGDYRFRRHQFAIKAWHIAVSGDVLTDAGLAQDDFGLLGAQWRTFPGQQWFLSFDAAGAATGSSQGYMHLLAGVGYEVPVGRRFSVYGTFAVGGGGGGNVDTGGGLLLDAGAGIQYSVSPNMFIDLSASRLWAPTSSFESVTLGMQLGYQFGPDETKTVSDEAVAIHPVRVRFVHQTYTEGGDNWRNRPEQHVGNLGAQLDYFVTPNWYLTGQGLGAYSGDAGAYMVGLVGGGFRVELGEKIFTEIEGLVGAAGGGGLSNGSGLVYQANLGIGVHLTDSLELLGTVGQLNAANGDLDAHVFGLSLGYSFRVLSLD